MNQRFAKMKKIAPQLLTVIIMLTIFVSCGTGGLNGTYLPKNEAAKNNYIAKFVFNDNEGRKNTVKIYVGVMGFVWPVPQEYSYSLRGDKLILEGGKQEGNDGGFELIYDKYNDEISLNMDDAFDIFGGLASFFGNVMDKNINSEEVSNALKKEIGNPIWGKEGTFDPE